MLQKEFREACEFGRTEVVLAHLQNGVVDPSFNHNFAIRQAAKQGHAEVVLVLLTDPRVDPSALANDALVLAVWSARLDVIRVLLADVRVDPTVDDNLPIRCAANEGAIDTMQLLLAKPHVDGTRAISGASSEAAHILAAHPRCGIHAYPELYAKHHPELTAEYERVRGQCRAVTWVMRELRWEGVAQCVVERLQGFLLY